MSSDLIMVINEYLGKYDDWYEAIEHFVKDANLALSQKATRGRNFNRQVDYKTFIVATYNLDGIAEQLFSDKKEKLFQVCKRL